VGFASVEAMSMIRNSSLLSFVHCARPSATISVLHDTADYGPAFPL
jgi:hypothetical protein